jgi:drug/metabolite transporter (DMT)-like permease
VNLKEWGAFGLLGLIWGSSFLWIKIALEEIGPFMLVGLRLAFGVAGLLILMVVTRSRLPRDRKILLAFFFASIVQTALPFILISWGETDGFGVASSSGTVPLFTIVIALLAA